MLSVSRRNFLSLTAATAVATALTTQAAHANTGTVLNGNGLASGVLRFTPLADVAYTSPFAQAFTDARSFTPMGAKTSDALVEATYTTSRPAAGTVYTRVIARRVTTGRDYYTALLTIGNTGQLTLLIERVINNRTVILGQKVLAATAPTSTFSYELALSVRATRLVAQVIVDGQAVETLVANDNVIPFYGTPQGTGTGISVYAGRTVPSTHVVSVAKAKADNWGEHRGALTASGWGKLIFEDDFNNGVIDGAKWRVRDKSYVGYDSGVNLKEAVTMGDSSAKIWLKKLATPVTYKDGKLREWATGYIDTMGKFSAESFRLEYRAKQPASNPTHIGAWGGIWMRPNNTALLGEIDISESYGYASGKQKVDISNRSEGTVHYGQQQGNKAKKNALIPVLGQNLADEYHTWAVEKTPAGIKFFFDGVEYLFVSSEDPRYQAALPAGEKFNIRLCMQAGNAYWGGLAETTADCAIEVDYVRVWEYVG